MLRDNVENHSDEHGEVERSRRSFFGRLAVGAVLSIAMPGVVHAAKSQEVKTGKNHRLAQQGRSAVRLPKHGSLQSARTERQVQKTATNHGNAKLHRTLLGKSGKAAPNQREHLHTAKADVHTASSSRVRDVYQGKRQQVGAGQHYASHSNHGGRVQSVIQPAPRSPILEPERSPLFLADHGRLTTHRSLAFQNPHTGDKLTLTYFEKGRYLSDALDEISFILRDHRTDDVHPIDPELLDQLHDLKQMLGLSQAFDIVCGYRSPLTNAKLHAEHSGVANNSFHMYGRAVDIRIERFDLRRIHNAAVAMHRGGVGYYPESNFIHLDTGTFRTWSL